MPALVTSDPGRELVARIRDASLKPLEVATFLDGLGSAERIQAIRSLGRAEQRRLYEAVRGFRPLQLADVVPSHLRALAPVRHYGRNTLPLFSRFEKRFCRPTDADPARPDRLWGYNESSARGLVGPGYFVLRPDGDAGELLVDYRELPTERPSGWPEIRRNDRGLSRFVYGFMVDTLRGVSEHVSIGSAARNGRDLGSWFVLCREA